MPQVVIQPAFGNQLGRINRERTVDREIRFTEPPYAGRLSAEDMMRLRVLHPEGRARFWGSTRAQDKNYKMLGSGDLVLFTGANHVQAVGVVGVILRNEAFGREMWVQRDHDDPWLNIYSIQELKETQIPYEDIWALEGFTRGDIFRSMRILDRERSKTVLAALRIEVGEEMIGVAIIGDKLRLVSIQVDQTVRLFDPYRQYSLLHVASLEAYRWKSLIEELEDMINSATVAEKSLQEFFERNPQFLCGDTYEAAHPHIILQRPSAGPLIPDFALKPSNEHALCDLLDLKLPQSRLVVGRSNRRRLSAALADACAQLREYREYFEEQANRDAIRETYGLRFYKPRMIVVIGKRGDYLAEDLRKAENDIPLLNITTYDDVLDRARTHHRRLLGACARPHR